MNTKNKLIIGRGIFVTIVIICFGLLVVSEKKATILLPKANRELNNYINENYSKIKDNLDIGNTILKDNKYIKKVSSQKNKNHYFYVTYDNKKITDTYKEDYVKGKKLLNNLKKSIEEEINNKTNTKCSIEFTSTLDKYTDKIQEIIIAEDNIIDLKIYTIKEDIEIDKWTPKDIAQQISQRIQIYKENKISPKYYTITITNTKDITQSIIIKLNNSFINNQYQEQIISDILNNNKSKLLNTYDIEYTYLN